MVKRLNPDATTIMHWRMRIGFKIRDVRKSRKMTQQRMATRLGWSRPSVVAIERGKQAVTLDQLVRIAILFRCSVSAFFPLGVIPPDDLAMMEGPSRLL
jgi:DNA-binding XRE family transcriptional regulator